MAEVQTYTLELENKGLMIMRPADVLPPGFLSNFLNLTANKTGFIESRLGSQQASSTNLGGPVHSQGRIIIGGTPYVYQGSGGTLYRAWSEIATGFSGNPLVMRNGGPDIAFLPQEIVFDPLVRYKDNGTLTTNFGIAGPMAAASAVAASATVKTIDAFQYTTNAAIQSAWAISNGALGAITTQTGGGSPTGDTYNGLLTSDNSSQTIWITKTQSIDLSKFVTAGDSTDSDFIAIYLAVNNPQDLTEVRVMFDVDPSTNDFAHNFYWTSVVSSLITLPSTGAQTAVQGLSTVISSPQSYVSPLPPALAGNPLDDTSSLIDSLSPSVLPAGTNQWIQILVPKSQFTRVGTNPNGWANVAAIRILITTNATGNAQLSLDQFQMQAGDNLNATDYQWMYRYRNDNTGSTSPFSPAPFNTSTIQNTAAVVTVRNPRDTQVTSIDLYRQGGNNSIFSFVLNQVVAAWSGTTTILDDIADEDLGDTTDLTQVELANLLQTPSQTVTAFYKTTDSGSVFTDYTSAVSDDTPGTYADLSSLDILTNGNWVLVGADGQFTQALMILSTNVNTVASTMLVQYWNGSEWQNMPLVIDGTSVGGKTLGQSGTIGWQLPANWASSTDNSTTAFYIRISVSAQLSSIVHVTEARIGANALAPTVCEIHNGSVWCDDNNHPDRLWFSNRFGAEEFDEDNFVVATLGGDPVVRPFSLDDQLFAFTAKTIFRIVGTTPASYQPYGTGSENGLFSKYAICRGAGQIFYRAYDGIYALPASGYPTKVSLPIDLLFHGIPSADGAMQPVDNAFALTECLEFFDNFLYFGYTDTNSSRQELKFDLQTNRWEPTDRPSTSYLTLPDEGEFYSGSQDGYVYRREIGNIDGVAPIDIRFRTQYLDFGSQSTTKQITEIVIDANLNGASLQFFADLDNGVGTPQSVTLTNSQRGPIYLPLSTDTKARNVALRVQGNNEGVLLQFFKVTFFFIVLPTQLTMLPTDWSDEGYSGDKRFRQLQLEIDTAGSNVSVIVQVDGVQTNSLIVNTPSRMVVPLSLADNTVGKLIRLIMGGAAPFSYYKHQFEFLKDPLQTTIFDTYGLDFGYTRWKFIRRMWLATITPATVTMNIWIDEVLEFTETYEITSPSGTGWTKLEIILPPGLKGMVFRFIFTSPIGFKIFLDQSDVEWHPLDAERSYQRAQLARST